MLQQVDRYRIEQVKFTFSTPLVNPPNGKVVKWNFFSAKGKFVFYQCFFRYFIKAHSFNARSGADKILINYRFIDTKNFKDLCSLVRLESGNAHFRKHF